jgi:class 3 adenylate cyclase
MIAPLKPIENRLRNLLPADLYTSAWLDSRYDDETADDDERRAVARILLSVADHLRAMQHILYDYVPRDVSRRQPQPGDLHYEWQEAVLMFTDLSGFTRLMEAHAGQGQAGAVAVHRVLVDYFSRMIHIIGEAGGTLLEFTGDAMLIRFRSYQKLPDVAQSVRAAVRMQRAMEGLANADTPLAMRIGIHVGRYITLDIGTPLRMDHVLLGKQVLITKKAEGASQLGRINLTDAAYEQVRDQFRFEPGEAGHWLLIDDLTAYDLGALDLPSLQRRQPRLAHLDHEPDSLVKDIAYLLDVIEPLACYLPSSVLRLLVNNAERASKLQVAPDYTEATVLFVNLLVLSAAADRLYPGEELALAETFSQVFARMNAAVEARGGVLKKVTYNSGGSDVMIFFGVPSGYSDNETRAASAALAIRDIIASSPQPVIGGEVTAVGCQIGMARGRVLAAEIGALRSRREYNVLGDVVNIAARLSVRAEVGQIQLSEDVYQRLGEEFICRDLGDLALKGKAVPIRLYELVGSADNTAGDLPDLLSFLGK